MCAQALALPSSPPQRSDDQQGSAQASLGAKSCVNCSRPMSRIGKTTCCAPCRCGGHHCGETVTIKGPKGQLVQTVHPRATVEIRDGESGRELSVTMKGLETTLDGALWGTTRANLQNMVEGVTKGMKRSSR